MSEGSINKIQVAKVIKFPETLQVTLQGLKTQLTLQGF